MIHWSEFNGKEYHFKKEDLHFDAAKKYCEKLGSNLVMPKSREELNYVNKKKSNFYVWLGASKLIDCPSNYCWLDGSSIRNANWGVSFPDDTNNVYIQAESDGSKWGTDSGGKTNAMCERSTELSSITIMQFRNLTDTNVKLNWLANQVAEIKYTAEKSVEDSAKEMKAIRSDVKQLNEKLDLLVGLVMNARNESKCD